MVHRYGLRFFLFEADGTLRRLPLRTLQGMVRDEDRMPQYAGQRLRVADAWLVFAAGVPVRLAKVEGRWWMFDERGRIVEGQLDAMRAAMNAAPDDAAGVTGERPGATFGQRLAQRQLERDWRWTPTSAEVTAIVHALWPEAAGRPVQLPAHARGQARRRYPVSSKARHVRQQCAEPVWRIRDRLEELSEHDLKGLIEALADDGRESGDGSEHLWRGIGAYAAWQLELRRARRSRRGTWYAWVEAMTRDRDDSTSWTGQMLEHRVCTSCDAAVAASRELLAKHAGKFDHATRIEADLCPALEWPLHAPRDARDAADEDAAEPRSPLVHPLLVTGEHANDK